MCCDLCERSVSSIAVTLLLMNPEGCDLAMPRQPTGCQAMRRGGTSLLSSMLLTPLAVVSSP